MNLRRFIDVAYAILVEEYQRLGSDLLSALEKVSALGRDPDAAVAERAEAPPEVVAAKNAQSMDALMGMMAGVKGAPVR